MALEVKHVAIWRALASADTNNSWLQLVAAAVPSTSVSSQIRDLTSGVALPNNVMLPVPMFDSVRYVIAPNIGNAGQTTIIFQELGLDGVWRTAANPISTNVPSLNSAGILIDGVIDGPLLGVRIFLIGISGNLAYVALYGTVRSNF